MLKIAQKEGSCSEDMLSYSVFERALMEKCASGAYTGDAPGGGGVSYKAVRPVPHDRGAKRALYGQDPLYIFKKCAVTSMEGVFV